MTHKSVIGLLIVSLFLGLAGSHSIGHAESQPNHLSTSQILNLYLAADGMGDGIQLVDGVGDEYNANGDLLAVYEVKKPIALGDLNGDGSGDGAMILAVQPTNGDLIIYSVHAILNNDGQAERVAFAVLGENAQLVNFAIRDQDIVVDMIVRGENDPECCATQTIRQTYRLQSSGSFDLVSEQGFAEANLPFAFDDQLKWRELANLTYPETLEYFSLDITDGAYNFTDETHAYAYMILDDLVMYGDLTGDGLDDAVVLIEYRLNNEPIMQYLYVVMNNRGIPYIAGWQDYSRVSDVEITSISIDNLRLTVEYRDSTHNHSLIDNFTIKEGHLVLID